MADDNSSCELPPVVRQYQRYQTEYILSTKKAPYNVSRSPIRQITFVTQKLGNPVLEMPASLLKTQSLAANGQFLERSRSQNWAEDSKAEFVSLTCHAVQPVENPTNESILRDLELIFNQLRAQDQFDPLFDEGIEKVQQFQTLSMAPDENSGEITLNNLELVDYAFDNILQYLRDQNADTELVNTLKHIQRIYNALAYEKSVVHIAYKEAAIELDSENQRLEGRIAECNRHQAIEEEEIMAYQRKVANMQRTDKDLREQLENAIFDVQTLVADNSSEQEQIRELDRELANEVKHGEEIMQRTKRSIADAKKFKDLLSNMQEENRELRDENKTMYSQKEKMEEQGLKQALIIEELEEHIKDISEERDEQESPVKADDSPKSPLNGYSIFDIEEFDLNCQFGKAMATMLQVSELDEEYLAKNKVSLEGINCIISFLQAGASAQSIAQFMQGVKQHLGKELAVKREVSVETYEFATKAVSSQILQRRGTEAQQTVPISSQTLREMDQKFVSFLDSVSKCRTDIELSNERIAELEEESRKLANSHAIELKSTALQAFYESAHFSENGTPRVEQAQYPPTPKSNEKPPKAQPCTPRSKEESTDSLTGSKNSSYSENTQMRSNTSRASSVSIILSDSSKNGGIISSRKSENSVSEVVKADNVIVENDGGSMRTEHPPKRSKRDENKQAKKRAVDEVKEQVSVEIETDIMKEYERSIQTGDIVIKHALVDFIQQIPQLRPLLAEIESHGIILEEELDAAAEQLIFDGSTAFPPLSATGKNQPVADQQQRLSEGPPEGLNNFSLHSAEEQYPCDQRKSMEMEDDSAFGNSEPVIKCDVAVEVSAILADLATLPLDNRLEQTVSDMKSTSASAQSLVVSESSVAGVERTSGKMEQATISGSSSEMSSEKDNLSNYKVTAAAFSVASNLRRFSQAKSDTSEESNHNSPTENMSENEDDSSAENDSMIETRDFSRNLADLRESNYENTDQIKIPGTQEEEDSDQMQTCQLLVCDVTERNILINENEDGAREEQHSISESELNLQENTVSISSRLSVKDDLVESSGVEQNNETVNMAVDTPVEQNPDDHEQLAEKLVKEATRYEDNGMQTIRVYEFGKGVQVGVEQYESDMQTDSCTGMKSIAVEHGFTAETTYEVKNKLRETDFAVQQMQKAVTDIKASRVVDQELRARLEKIEQAQKTEDLSYLLGINVKGLVEQKEQLQNARSEELNKIHFSTSDAAELQRYQNRNVFEQRKQLIGIFKSYNATKIAENSQHILRQRLEEIDSIRNESYAKSLDLAKTNEIRTKLLSMQCNAYVRTDYAFDECIRKFQMLIIRDFFLVQTTKIVESQRYGLEYKEDGDEITFRFLPCLLLHNYESENYKFYTENNAPPIVRATLAKFEHETTDNEDEQLETPTILPVVQDKVGFLRLTSMGSYDTSPEFIRLLHTQLGVQFRRRSIEGSEYLELPVEIQPKSKNWLLETLNLIIRSWYSEEHAVLHPEPASAYITDEEEDVFHFVASTGLTQKEFLYFPYYVVYFARERYKLKTLAIQFILEFLVTFVLHATESHDLYTFFQFLFYDQFAYEVGDIFVIMLKIRAALGIEVKSVSHMIPLDLAAHLIEALYENWPSQRKIALLDVFCKIADETGSIELQHHEVFPLLLEVYSSYRTSVYNLLKKQLPLSFAAFEEALAAGNLVVSRTEAVSLFVGEKLEVYKPDSTRLFSEADLARLFTENEIGRFLCVTPDLEHIVVDKLLAERILSCKVSEQRLEETAERLFNKLALSTASEQVKIGFDAVQEAANNAHAALSVLDYEDVRKAQIDILFQLFVETDKFVEPEIWESVIETGLHIVENVSQ